MILLCFEGAVETLSSHEFRGQKKPFWTVVAHLGPARGLFLPTHIILAFTMKTSTGAENYGQWIGGLALTVRYPPLHPSPCSKKQSSTCHVSNVQFAFLLTPHPTGHRVCSSQRVSAIQMILPSKLSRSSKPTWKKTWKKASNDGNGTIVSTGLFVSWKLY